MAKLIPADSLADIVRPNQHVYVPGSSGAPTDFMADLMCKPERSRQLQLLTTYVPGINQLAMDCFDPSILVTGLFMQPSLSGAQLDGRFRALPLSYAGFVQHLLDRAAFDLTVVQIAPPDEHGNCSFGPAVEFMPTVLKKSGRILGLINHRTPRIHGALSIPYDRLDFACEVDTALPVYSAASDDTTKAIAQYIEPLIPDGCVLQVGLGKVPMALSRLLCDRRNLRLHSGMLSDGLIDMAEAGALDPDFLHTTCVLVGSERLYSWASEMSNLRILGCDVTHSPRVLTELDRFISVNSALEVDLFGQCNLEHANGRAVSGAGGAPDFARAAKLSPGGRSIVALNATHHRGKGSRIVPSLTDMAMTSLPRIDVDHIVTEYGAANLCGASVHERALAIISVAAPEFQEELQQAWHNISRRL